MFQPKFATTGNVFKRVLGIALFCVMASPAYADDANAGKKPPRTTKTLELNDAKAGTLLALLAPDHVRVVVSRTNDGIRVEGTTREVDALSAFAKIVTRNEGTNFNTDAAALAELRKTWDSEKTYKMPKPVADVFFAVLAFDDVPVYVSHADSGLTIEASSADQKIINRIVQIARGDELSGDKAKAHKATPAEPGKKKTDAKPAKKESQEKRKRRADKSRGDKPRRDNGRSDWTPDRVEPDRALANRVQGLARRVAKLEAQVDQLEKIARQHTAPAHGDHTHAPGDQHAAAPDHKSEPKPKPRRDDDNKMIDRRYRLPQHHADNLFALFAPADITDVIISREGNQLRIRANAADHKTIKRLIDLLKRAESKDAPRRD